MNGSEQVGYEGFSYPNWNATATQPLETNPNSNTVTMSNTATPKQTFYSQNAPFQVVTPKSSSNTSNTGVAGGTQDSNGMTSSATSAGNVGITRVPSVSGSYFHQRSVSKGTFAPFISPTSASANSSTTPASTNNTTTVNNNNNIYTNSDNYNGNSVKTRNDYDNSNKNTSNVASGTNTFPTTTTPATTTITNNTTSSSSTFNSSNNNNNNNNVLANAHGAMTAGNTTSSNTITPSSFSLTSVDHMHRSTHPTNLFGSNDNNNNINSNTSNTNALYNDHTKNVMWRESDKLPASIAAKSKSPLPMPHQTLLQEPERRASTPQSISSHVNIHPTHHSNTSSNSKHIFKQHDAAHVTINDREAKPFVPFVQNVPAPQLAALAPMSNMSGSTHSVNHIPYHSPNELAPSSNNNNNNNMGNGNKTGNYTTSTFPAPVNAFSASEPTNEATASSMNFFNRTSMTSPPSSSSVPVAATGDGSVLFSPSASTPFVQHVTNNNQPNSHTHYYVPPTSEPQPQAQEQWNTTSLPFSQNQLRHRRRNGENEDGKRSRWLMGALLHRLLRRGDDVDSDETDENNTNSENENDTLDGDDDDDEEDNDNNNNNIINSLDGTKVSRSSTTYNNNNNNVIHSHSPSRPALFQKDSQEQRHRRRKRKNHNAHKPRPLYQTRFGHPEDDLPLLTELGIYPANILRKALVVLNPLQSISPEVMIDTDLTGPLIFAITLAILLSLHGKIQFSAIYGLCVLGMFLFKFLLSLMHDRSVPLQFIMSALGYALLPNVILAFIRNLQYWLIGSFGRVLLPAAILTILWSSWCATTLLVKGQGMETQRYLVLYPIILFYAIFAALTIF